MERLSPRANGLEYVKGRELVASDLGEAIPQHKFDAAIEELAVEKGQPVPSAS